MEREKSGLFLAGLRSGHRPPGPWSVLPATKACGSYFRVKLQTVCARSNSECLVRECIGARKVDGTGRCVELVEMVLRQVERMVEEVNPAFLCRPDLIEAELARAVCRWPDACTEHMGDRLRTLADAEKRYIAFETLFDVGVLVSEEGVASDVVDLEPAAVEHDSAYSLIKERESVSSEWSANISGHTVCGGERGDAVVGRVVTVANEHQTFRHCPSFRGRRESTSMCAIAGIWSGISPAGLDTVAARREVGAMLDLLAHRGPDAEGFAVLPGIGVVGHRRLSIMDPVGGDQPIWTADGARAIAANGEIYNYPSLRNDLSVDHVFTTGSDTEAILHLYERHGAALVNHLEGMYAFAIVDGTRLVLGRDPLGIKPLYWAEQSGHVWFASEIKALAPFCSDVREFPPGTIFISDIGVRTFYEVPFTAPVERSAAHYVGEVRSTLEAAVVSHCMSDVGVGAFLSGGLDSSIIAALAKRHLGELHTFAVGVEGSTDLAAARLVADHLGTMHHEYRITEAEVLTALAGIIHSLESFDQDLVRSAVPTFFAARLAAQHTKVILTGEGADELFAGYTYHRSIADPVTLHAELRRTVTTLHDINLQRADRLTMLHSIEGRVPFLDLRMVELAQRIPVSLKLAGDPAVEKWVLRKAFEDLLPPEIVWRRKEQFDEGSGTADLLPRLLRAQITEDEATAYRAEYPGVFLRSAEECLYHRILVASYDHPGPVLANVARWAGRRL